MIYTAIRYSKHSDPPLSILGDALASFLKMPDVHTQGMGIISNRDIQADCSVAWKQPAPREWRPARQRWASAASRRRWYSGLIMWVALSAEQSSILNKLRRSALVFSVTAVFLHLGIRTLRIEGAPTGLKSLFRLGLGTVDFNTLVHFLPYYPVGAAQPLTFFGTMLKQSGKSCPLLQHLLRKSLANDHLPHLYYLQRALQLFSL